MAPIVALAAASVALSIGASATAATATAASPLRAARPDLFTTSVTVNATGSPLGHFDAHYRRSLHWPVPRVRTLNGGQFDAVGNLHSHEEPRTPVMRFGGNSVDRSYSGISDEALAGLVRLATATGWSVLYSENLGHYNATVAANGTIKPGTPDTVECSSGACPVTVLPHTAVLATTP